MDDLFSVNGLYNLENFIEFVKCLLFKQSTNELDLDLPVSVDLIGHEDGWTDLGP